MKKGWESRSRVPPGSCFSVQVSVVGAISGRERMEDKFGGAVSSGHPGI